MTKYESEIIMQQLYCYIHMRVSACVILCMRPLVYTDLLFHIRQWQHRPTDALGPNQDLFKILGFLTYIHMGGYGHNRMTHSGFFCLYRNLLFLLMFHAGYSHFFLVNSVII